MNAGHVIIALFMVLLLLGPKRWIAWANALAHRVRQARPHGRSQPEARGTGSKASSDRSRKRGGASRPRHDRPGARSDESEGGSDRPKRRSDRPRAPSDGPAPGGGRSADRPKARSGRRDRP